jgi:fructose-1,6-bisphosphatase I
MQPLAKALRQQGVDPDLSHLIDTIGKTCKMIAQHLIQGPVNKLHGCAGTLNSQGERQKQLDIIANDLLKQNLLAQTLVSGLASEEEEHCVIGDPKGRYLIVFDPLDGSSNIDINVSVGTIFSILCAPEGQIDDQSFLQRGHNQVAAGYVLYGPSVIMALTTGQGVDMYSLSHDGNYYQTRHQVKIPPHTQEFAINMSNQRFWDTSMQRYIAHLLEGEQGPIGKRFNMRWIASMVAEVHRILTRGGIFMYPRDNRDSMEHGKLRLMYEGNPMSLLVEQAGGVSSTGNTNIVDICPNDIHQRVPVILGAMAEVKRVITYHR